MSKKNGSNGLPVNSGLYWKDDYLYVEIWYDGKRLGQFATRTKVIKEALDFKADKLKKHKAALEENGSPDTGILINGLLKDYIDYRRGKEDDGGEYKTGERDYERNSYKTANRITKHLAPHFGLLKPAELTDEIMKAYKSKRIGNRAKVTTINSEFRILRAAIRRGTKSNPKTVKLSEVPDFSQFINNEADTNAARTGTISDEQDALIVQHGSEHFIPAFLTCKYTGVRSKEVRFIERNGVNFITHIIEAKAGATKKARVRHVPMNERIEPILRAWEEKTQREHPNCRWFFHHEGKRVKSWSTTWDATLLRAGLRVPVIDEKTGKQKMSKPTKYAPKGYKMWKNLVGFHDTRRTSITTNDEDGIPHHDNKTVSGHATESAFNAYNQSRKAAERVRLAQNAALRVKAGEVPTPDSAAPSEAELDRVIDQMARLGSQLKDGLITKEMFDAMRLKVYGPILAPSLKS